MPFVNAKIGGAAINFEDFVDSSTSFSYWAKDKVRGIVTDEPIGMTEVNMLWETGHVTKQPVEMKKCNYNMTKCYEVRTVPVIKSVSHNQGYLKGGQILTIEGFGFENKKSLTIDVAGQPCKPIDITMKKITCITKNSATPSPTTAVP
jgi:hypothetical protein